MQVDSRTLKDDGGHIVYGLESRSSLFGLSRAKIKTPAGYSNLYVYVDALSPRHKYSSVPLVRWGKRRRHTGD
jgi:hypothetical protein